jgi:M6 family metalloprotease-like protein
VEFADTPHNLKVTAPDWNRLFFSTNVLDAATNATGQITHGSVNDYYREVSCNQFSFEGKVFDWVKLPKSRADYSQGTASRRSRSEFFKEVLDKLLAREPKGALTGFDGLTIIYAGDRFATANRGTLFWPHRSSTTYEGKNWSYVICPEGGSRMANISVFCHEFGHILGLPDLYARAENPGSEGVGAWCAMSNQAGEGRPQHFSVWCKEQLGWLRPATIDPSVRQKLLLSPIESTTNQCYKILIRPDGSEYFLLENRQKRGFDRSLAATGLLIWRVVGNRLILEESHGVEGPAGPRVFPGSVPYPSGANDSFTPFTVPSSRPQLAGGTAIHLQQIRQHPDGRISFEIGTEFQ